MSEGSALLYTGKITQRSVQKPNTICCVDIICTFEILLFNYTQHNQKGYFFSCNFPRLKLKCHNQQNHNHCEYSLLDLLFIGSSIATSFFHDDVQ